MALRIKSTVKNTYSKILIYVAAPAFIACIFILMLFIVYTNNHKNLLKESYESKMEAFYNLQDRQLQDIAISLRTLSDDSRFIDTVNGTLTSSQDITHAQKILKQIQSNYPFVDEVSIVDRIGKQVYTPSDTYPMSRYFSDVYGYDDYNYNYWMQYKAPLSEKSIISPTYTVANDSQKIIVPIVFTRIGQVHLSNIIIVNVNLSMIISDFNSNKLSDGSLLRIVNKENNRIFDENGIAESLDKKLLDKINLDTISVFDYNIARKKYYMISYTPIRSVLGYSYIAAVPYSDIYSSSFKLLAVTLLFCVPLFILLLLIIKFSSTKIYSPFKSIATTLDIDTDGNIVNNIRNSITAMLDSNQKMSSQINNTLPIMEEQYLIRVLNSSEHYYSSEYISSAIHFDYDYFCSVIIKFNQTESFYQKYNHLQAQMLECSLAEIIHTSFAAQFKTYIIPSDSSTLYILLNLKGEQYIDNIHKILNDFKAILSADEEDVKITTSVGSIYSGLAGLKKSHTEALNNISGTTWLNRISLKKADDPEEAQTVKFTSNDEAVIYNHLLVGNTDDALTAIDTIILDNTNKNLSKDGLIHIYIQILNIIFKVMRIKNIEYDTEHVGDLNLLNDIISHSPLEIHKIIVSLFDILKKSNNNKKIDIDNILKYIQQHYKEDIYLDYIAEHFDTSSSYLSRLIKKETSQTFIEYINSLRIEEAKKLLKNTEKSITEIYESIGFTNRSTFIRVFKTIVGSTPSDYRKMVK